MKRFKECMNEMTTQGWIVFIIIALLIVTVVSGGVYYFVKNQKVEPLASLKTDPQNKKVRVKMIDSETRSSQKFELTNRATDAALSTDSSRGLSEPVSYQVQKEEVKIALIIAKNEYDVANVISGSCGDVYMVRAYVSGPAVLTNSYKALFGNKVYGDFLPGNIIPTYHPNLFFKNVEIVNGIAKIYLFGDFETGENTCKTELALAQLKETAKYYPNVSGVEIYQNGQRID